MRITDHGNGDVIILMGREEAEQIMALALCLRLQGNTTALAEYLLFPTNIRGVSSSALTARLRIHWDDVIEVMVDMQQRNDAEADATLERLRRLKHRHPGMPAYVALRICGGRA